MINCYNKPLDAYPNHKDYEKLKFIKCGGYNNMTKQEFIKKVENLSEEDFYFELFNLLMNDLEDYALGKLMLLSIQEIAERHYRTDYLQGLYKEQLKMTKSYLKGEMYNDKEIAAKMLHRQIENIEDTLRIGDNNDD